MCCLFKYEKSFISSCKWFLFWGYASFGKLNWTENSSQPRIWQLIQTNIMNTINVLHFKVLILLTAIRCLHFLLDAGSVLLQRTWMYYSYFRSTLTHLHESSNHSFQWVILKEFLVNTYWNHIADIFFFNISLRRSLFSVIRWIPSQHCVTEFNGALNSSCPILNSVTL